MNFDKVTNLFLVTLLMLGGCFSLIAQEKPKSDWQLVSPVKTQGHAIVVDPKNPQIMYIAQRPEGIFKTTDGGKNWTAINNGIKIKNATGRGIATNNLTMDPRDSNILYLGLEWNGVYISTDGGQNWVEHNNGIKEGLGMNAIDVAVHPKDRNILYVGTDSGGYKSVDGGKNWTFLESLRAKTIMDFVFDPANHDIIYATVYVPLADEEAGVWKSTDGGKTWKPTNKGLPESPKGKASRRDNTTFDLLIHPKNPKLLIAATVSGIYRSTNAGKTWTFAKDTVVAPIITLSSVKSKPDIVYGFLWKKGVYKSLDFGATWKLIPNSVENDFMWRLTADPQNPNLIYGAVNGGIFKLETER